MRSPITYTLFILSTFLLGEHQAADECPCRFNVPPEEEADCRVYAQIGDRVLIPWHRASQDCLDTYNIRSRAIPEATLSLMCPFGDGSRPSVASFVNYVRFNGGTAAVNGIKLSYPQFFTEGTGSSVVFLDTITDDSGGTVDCKASESSCWTVVRAFFTDNPERVSVHCVDLYNRLANDLEKEQSFARIRQCENPSTPECEPLWAQVNEFVTDPSNDPPRGCSAYGLGAAQAVPTPEGCPEPTVGGNTTSASPMSYSLGLSVCTMLVLPFYSF